MSESSAQSPHSKNQFVDYRNFWWNKGFIDLMAKRIKLNKHKSLLDVGCGQCHWSKILTPYLDKPAYVVGVDKDPTWAKGSTELKRFFKEQACWFELYEGDALNLPFDDGTFDIVTCQTVLIHVGNPVKAIEEMKRVLKPGGTILCVEPNNRIQSLLKTSESENISIDEMIDHVKYALIAEQGKKRLGFGDNSLGDLLPGMLSKLGFQQIDVRLSDKAIVMVPPYDTQEQMATTRHWEKGNSGDAMNNSDLFYFEAFGDKYLSFYEEYHQKYEGKSERVFEALRNNDFHSAGGALMYLVSGKKVS